MSYIKSLLIAQKQLIWFINKIMGKIMKIKYLAYLALIPFLSFSTAIFSEDEEVEEVVVTGSFIKTNR